MSQEKGQALIPVELCDAKPKPPHPDATEVLNEEGILQGWMVPQERGGTLFRAAPGGGKHPNHRPGSGPSKRSVREKLLKLTDYAAEQLLQQVRDGEIYCPGCGKKHGDVLTFQRLMAVLDKAGKYGVGRPTEDDDGRPLLQPIVVLPPLDPQG